MNGMKSNLYVFTTEPIIVELFENLYSLHDNDYSGGDLVELIMISAINTMKGEITNPDFRSWINIYISDDFEKVEFYDKIMYSFNKVLSLISTILTPLQPKDIEFVELTGNFDLIVRGFF